MRLIRWYALAPFGLVVGALTFWVGCRPRGDESQVRATVADDPRFSSMQLAMRADSKTGDVFVNFDAQAAGLSSGDEVELVWDVLQTRTDVNCSALRKHEKVTIPAGGKVSLRFKVDPSTLTDVLPLATAANDQQDKYHALRGGAHFPGNTFVEGCLVKGGQPVAKAQSAPEANIAQAVQGGLGLQEAEPTAFQPAHIRYAERCAEAIGYVEPLNCLQMGQEVPITTDGVKQTSIPTQCDKPVYLEGPQRCGPYTRVGRLKLYKDKQRTEEREDSTAVFFCRHYDDASLRQASWDPTRTAAQYPYFDDVAIIMQNRDTGKTCFFQALGADREESRQLFGARVPPPTETDEEFAASISQEDRSRGATTAGRFWLQPNAISQIHCVSCHDNDPFMHSPWIDQMRVLNQSGQPTAELLVPSEPFNEYKIIGAGFGFERWDNNYAFDLPQNKCTTCHRISVMKTCRNWIRDAFPSHLPDQPANLNELYAAQFRTAQSVGHPDHHWMPPPPRSQAQMQNWLNKLPTFDDSVKELRRCCEMQMNGHRVLGYGFINQPTQHTLSQDELSFLSQNGCPVIPASEVVER